ncbi:hypothetical protein DSECCO2_437930 [anaerobic digester metagenome]
MVSKRHLSLGGGFLLRVGLLFRRGRDLWGLFGRGGGGGTLPLLLSPSDVKLVPDILHRDLVPERLDDLLARHVLH